ncbi:hypothetical protein FQN57_006977 [Myotisia sp. PD_48]|nr:hypothetical protein FQN57_006977 [Myotisia sp. PD_48]
MIRLRRYRVFVIFSIIVVLAFVQFSGVRDWSNTSPSTGYPPVKKPAAAPPSSPPPPPPPPPPPRPGSQTEDDRSHGFAPDPTLPKKNNNNINNNDKQSQPQPTSSKLQDGPKSPVKTVPPVTPNGGTKILIDDNVVFPHDQGRLDIPGMTDPDIRWTKLPELFPVPSSAIIPLPTGKPKAIPKIQFNFPAESAQAKEIREKKFSVIRQSLLHSWNGYKKHAMGHDEVSPVTGGYRDPFMGWGATLVDSLDTLWIAGLKDEFEAALKEVEKIDFKTSQRRDIPLFETVIRYLGGLVGAYDISGQKYKVLLDKAVELAEILMGAFDTPNRMPITYFHWIPAYALEPHRALARTVLAEIGSLSIEFTRLAQITKDNRYYDAVARITNELEAFQDHTTIPGLWPTYVDVTGCEKTIFSPSKRTQANGTADNPDGTQPVSPSLEKRKTPEENPLFKDAQPADYNTPPQKVNPSPPKSNVPTNGPSLPVQNDCKSTGMQVPSHSRHLEYTLAALADSTYEYLPKTYMLLGGLNDQYKNMYKKARDATIKHLLFRPMVPDNNDILFHATVNTPKSVSNEKDDFNYRYHSTHLGCFVGGMFGIGAKIFGYDDDLAIAQKLTDGCVWAYNSTTTGIMPEEFLILPCESTKSCQWNQTRYYDTIDPYEAERKARLELFLETQAVVGEAEKTGDKGKSAESHTQNAPPKRDSGNDTSNAAPADAPDKPVNIPEEGRDSLLAKRETPTQTIPPSRLVADMTNPLPGGIVGPTPTIASHEQYAETRIKEERIPPGFTSILSAKYILRPEAIESVFIMYRITGDETWRDKGWAMFNAIDQNTRTELGSSAIRDVTSEAPFFEDEMESFWLGETLKYFLMLFSDPSVVNLDEYVFNTEAHPVRRPQS